MQLQWLGIGIPVVEITRQRHALRTGRDTDEIDGLDGLARRVMACGIMREKLRV